MRPGVTPMARLGNVLIGFGVAGLAILVGTVIALLLAVGPLAAAAADLDAARGNVAALVGPSADALEATATSAEHAGQSLGQSETTARDAASVTSQLADAMSGLAAFSSAFADTAARARSLADDLNRTADAIHQNELDTATAATQLRTLSTQLRDLQSRLGADQIATPSQLDRLALPVAVGLGGLLLIWLGGLAVGAIWLGRQLRAGRLPWPLPVALPPTLPATLHDEG
jgi:hypothetical protein